jgi:hypothetical protein
MGDSHFFRYTDLPSLVHILTSRQLTLLNPLSWDDKNDSNFLTIYKEKRELTSVLALCFTRSAETYHHWRIFAPSSSGVRITLNEQLLRPSFAKIPGLQLGDMEYVKLEDMRRESPRLNRLPFLQRYPYQHESEVRLLWESATEKRDSFQVPIELGAIELITLSPWLHPSLTDSVKSLIKGINGCSSIAVHRTTLISNGEWLKHGQAAT